MNSFVITIRRPYTDHIVEHTKKFEIRTRIPKNLAKGDKIYVTEAGTQGDIYFSFIVGNIIRIQPSNAWPKFGQNLLGVSFKEFYEYTKNYPYIYLIEITQIELICAGFNISDMSIKRPPMWFARVKWSVQ